MQNNTKFRQMKIFIWNMSKLFNNYIPRKINVLIIIRIVFSAIFIFFVSVENFPTGGKICTTLFLWKKRYVR